MGTSLPDFNTTPMDWGFFCILLFSLLFVDLWIQRNDHGSSKKEAAIWSCIWIGIGLAFSLYVHFRWGSEARNEYLAAYLIEKALSVDNLFVFLLIFGAMKIPRKFQRTALAWGILGALVFRAIFIYLGAAALERWAAVGIIFALLLFYAGIQAFFAKHSDDEESAIVNWLSKHLPISKNPETAHFFVHEDGKLKMTPILISIVALELTDIVFAIDSVPAALSFSQEVFIVYSSNAFAILGLRALYVLLAGLIADLKYLHYGLAAVLIFAGLKMVAHSCETLIHLAEVDPTAEVGMTTAICQRIPGLEYMEIDPLYSIFIILFLIGIAAFASIVAKKRS